MYFLLVEILKSQFHMLHIYNQNFLKLHQYFLLKVLFCLKFDIKKKLKQNFIQDIFLFEIYFCDF